MRAYGCTDGERLVGVFGVATDGVAARRLRRMGVPAASAGTSRLTLWTNIELEPAGFANLGGLGRT